MKLFNLSLQTLLFYSDQTLPGPKDQYPEACLSRKLGLTLEAQQDGNLVAQGKLNDLDVVIRACMAHDTDITRLQISLPGEGSADTWHKLLSTQEDSIQGLFAEGQQGPWAISRIFSAEISLSPSNQELSEVYDSLAMLRCGLTASEPSDITPYGWLWTLEGQPAVEEHDVLLLIPADRAEHVHAIFLDPLRQGLSRIELYLQKGRHHARQHEIVRVQLNQAMQALQHSMVSQVGDVDFTRIQMEPLALEQISQQLLRFNLQKAALELLANSLRSNLSAFGEHLGRVRLDAPRYVKEKERLSRQVEQIESDLTSANVILESTAAFQDIQRSAESSRFERASYLLGGTAALLAGISLFNSLLDIWSQSLEGSSWLLPASWLRIPLALAASAAIPLAATWFIARRKKAAWLALLISLAALASMLLSTILVNR